jgi:CBS domain-containing protein
VGKVLSQATDVMTRKLITFFGQKNGQAPMPYCWLVFGSQAREDPTMGSDQYNALPLAEEPNEEQAASFRPVAYQIDEGLQYRNRVN